MFTLQANRGISLDHKYLCFSGPTVNLPIKLPVYIKKDVSAFYFVASNEYGFDPGSADSIVNTFQNEQNIKHLFQKFTD